jgi:hypothetical protein
MLLYDTVHRTTAALASRHYNNFSSALISDLGPPPEIIAGMSAAILHNHLLFGKLPSFAFYNLLFTS